VDFFSLLKESGIAKPGAVWKDVKKEITSDPRYDAVGSSTLREELFNSYLKANGTTTAPNADSTAGDNRDGAVQSEADEDADRERKRKEQSRSVKIRYRLNAIKSTQR